MTVKEIVKKYLEKNGYDGLYHNGDCGCLNNDLVPCDEIALDCEAGYLKSCPDSCGEQDDWLIGPKEQGK